MLSQGFCWCSDPEELDVLELHRIKLTLIAAGCCPWPGLQCWCCWSGCSQAQGGLAPWSWLWSSEKGRPASRLLCHLSGLFPETVVYQRWFNHGAFHTNIATSTNILHAIMSCYRDTMVTRELQWLTASCLAQLTLRNRFKVTANDCMQI